LSTGGLTGDSAASTRRATLKLAGRKKHDRYRRRKNIYPEDIETFSRACCKRFCVFAANYIWQSVPMRRKTCTRTPSRAGAEYSEELRQDINARNNRLLTNKRVHGAVRWTRTSPDGFSQNQTQCLAERLAKLDGAAAICLVNQLEITCRPGVSISGSFAPK